ncbi:MAG: GNAT family N-acetyltransferase [Sphingomonadales bacterium]|nr:MAG: GNAT family N-acetyltransferase [Sphingomonadales bacterium]
MIYRDGTLADIPAIDALFRESFDQTFGHLYAPEDEAAFFDQFTPEAWAEELAQPDLRFRLAVDDEGVAGFCKISDLQLPAKTEARAMELRQLYLHERAKGKGVAQAMMTWAIEQARARDAEEVWLTVYSDNHRAKRLYERYGFEEQGSYKFMVGNHADEDLLMRLVL